MEDFIDYENEIDIYQISYEQLKDFVDTEVIDKYLRNCIYNPKFNPDENESFENRRYQLYKNYANLIDYAINGNFAYLANNILKFIPDDKVKYEFIRNCATDEQFDFIFKLFNLGKDIDHRACININVFNNVKTLYELNNSVLIRDDIYKTRKVDIFTFIMKNLKLRFSNMPNTIQDDEVVIGKFEYFDIVDHIILYNLYPINNELIKLLKNKKWYQLVKQLLNSGQIKDPYGKINYIITNNLDFVWNQMQKPKSYTNEQGLTVIENGFRVKSGFIDENDEYWDDMMKLSLTWFCMDYIILNKKLKEENVNGYVNKLVNKLGFSGNISKLAYYFGKYDNIESKSDILRKLKLWHPKEYDELQRMMTFNYGQSGLKSTAWKESVSSNPFFTAKNKQEKNPEWLAGFLKSQGKQLDPEKQKALYAKYPMADTFPEKELEKIYVQIKKEELEYKTLDINGNEVLNGNEVDKDYEKI